MFNIFFLAFFAIGVGLLIAMFITRQPGGSPGELVPPEDDFAKDPAKEMQVEIDTLFRLAEKLCAENGLNVKERTQNSDREWYWTAESMNEVFAGTYALAFFRVTENGPFVLLSEILQFKDFIKSIGGARGLALTNGFFTRDTLQPLEGPKVSLFNKTHVLKEMKRLGV